MQTGDSAPAFDLPASGGRRVRSSDYAGRAYVLYFYPKADTTGCTKEAIAFQERCRHSATSPCSASRVIQCPRSTSSPPNTA